MINRFSLKALDRCLRDLLDAEILSAGRRGKSIVLAGLDLLDAEANQ